jgi:uncharacterized protein YeaO (DUF488 family)
MIKIKRVYEDYSDSDGYRILIDRLWPRGKSKQRAKIDLWLKEIAPSDELRRYFCHDSGKWSLFINKYTKELENNIDLIKQIQMFEKEHGVVTLLYSSKDEKFNNAIVLKKFLSVFRNE